MNTNPYHAWSASFVLGFSFWLPALAQPVPSHYSIPRLDGARTVVPTSGIWFAEEDVRRARALESLDASIRMRSLESKEPAVQQAMLDALGDVQRMAAEETAQGIELTRSVSSGTSAVKSQRFSSADALTKWIESLLSRAPPTSDAPVTRIIGLPAGSYVYHYKTLREYKENAAAGSTWKTYTSGQRMRLGLYYFRLTSAQGIEVVEEVTVWDDPTEKSIALRAAQP